MARIPDEEIEKLKREVSLERLAEARGVKLKRHGADLIGLCPFHDDREPSLVISPQKNLWHCLGACQAGGSVVDWVMRAEGVSFRHAAELLRAEHFPLAAGQPVKLSTVRKLDFAGPDEADQAVLGRVVGYYHACLKKSAEAQGYLRERGLVHPDVVDHFRLGYADRTLGYRLPLKNRRTGALVRGQLQRLGVLRESGHEHLVGSLVIPIVGADASVLGMYGRKVGADLRPGTPLHLYLPGPHRGVFNVAALTESRDVILCEALIDALTFWCAGYSNVTSAYGVEGFTREIFDALKQHAIERVLIAYDRDDAGERAAEKLAPELAAAGMEVFRVVFPRGMDANEYARKVTPADKSLGTALRAAKWMAGTRPVAVAGEIATSTPAVDANAAITGAENAAEHERAPAIDDDTSVFVHAVERDGSAQAEPPSLAAESLAPATPTIAAEAPHVEVRDGDEVVMRLGPRQWRIRGLDKNTSLASIKVSVRVMVGGVFFQDQVELMSARARAAFLGQAADELSIEERVLKGDLGRVTCALEELLEARLRGKLEPKKPGYEMSDAERADALALLRDPKLLDRILGDFDRCGVVGEVENKLALYLAAVSRKLDQPLAVVIQSSSAAGKSSLMDAVLAFLPDEEQAAYSAMTGQALFYMGGIDLQHKVLAVAEQRGAESASYALKLLQSSGELTIASTGKDPQTGRLVTHEYQVRGPVVVMMTTSAAEVDEELLNRCLVLTVDEGREQTRAIQRLQREAHTLGGLVRKEERGRVMRLHQNAQRLLRPLHVVNPFTAALSFADHATRTRRDHAKYLALIDAVALLHQYQRPVKTTRAAGGELRYIEVTRGDIEIADKLAQQVLAQGLDELGPVTRRLLDTVSALVGTESAQAGIDAGDFRFSRRWLRERLQWGETQLRVHLCRLVAMEYLIVHRGTRGRSFEYELGDTTTTELRGVFAGGSRPPRGGGGREVSVNDDALLDDLAGNSAEHRSGDEEENLSYTQATGSSYAQAKGAA